MITRSNLPEGFQPYDKLTLCSNILAGGGHLLEAQGALPIVIGKGPLPLVWLQAPTDTQGKEFILLVAASVASHPAISVSQSASGVSVFAGGAPILNVYAPNNTEAVVDKLDLRPLGYNIHGDSRGLVAGGMKLARNTAAGSQVLISFGGA